MTTASNTDLDTPLRGPLAVPRLRRTLRFGFRTAWDSLGFVCAASLTVFAALCVSLTVLALFPGRASAWLLAAAAFVLVVPPIYAGACLLAHRVYEHDEPSYADVWRGFRELYGGAARLAACHLLGTAVLAANIVFYLSRASIGFFLLAVVFGYLLLFWAMNLLYHWPLFVASASGIIARPDSRPPGIQAVFRNGFLLTISAPGYTFGLLVVLLLMWIPMIASGVGLALLAPGLTAFLTTRAARDQLVRYRILPEPEDPDEPVADERWTV